jgi:hypothetical protein
MFDHDHTFACNQTRKSDHTIARGENLVASLTNQINPTMSW